jgi:hypothetical protein
MTELDANAVVKKETDGRWHSMRSSFINLMNAMDYDHREHTDAVIDQLRESVTQLKARLSVLEQQERLVSVAATQPEERS